MCGQQMEHSDDGVLKEKGILQPQWQCGSNCYLSVTIELTDLQLFTSIYSPADLFLTCKSPSHLGLCLSL